MNNPDTEAKRVAADLRSFSKMMWKTDAMRPRIEQAATLMENINLVVDEQANEMGLWFVAQTPGEEILQIALRRLHSTIEFKTGEQCARDALRQVEN